MRKASSLGFVALFVFIGYAAARGTISGTIKGPDGAPFRAAFIRSQNLQTKMTTWVLSDNQGKYWADNLAPGSYEVSATSIGYKGDPAQRMDVKVEDGQAVTINFTMEKGMVRWNQLTRYQAGMLLPVPKEGTAEAKDRYVVLHQCSGCHFISKWGMRLDHDGWSDAIGVMKTLGVADIKPEIAEQAATYLSSVFGPDSDTPASPAQLPGYQKVKREHDYWSDDSLTIEYVDYQLTGDPRDVPGSGRPDKNGNVWLEMEGGLSKLNPNTGELKTFRLDDPSRPRTHEVFPTADGSSVWLTVTYQNALARFDTRTEKFDPVYKDVYNGPLVENANTNDPFPWGRDLGPTNGNTPRTHTCVMDLQGNLWCSGRPLKKFSLKTKEFTNFSNVPDVYGITTDKEGNIWTSEYIPRDYRQLVKVDPKTDKITKYTPPNADGQAGTCRRVHVDSQDTIWCADYLGGNLLRFDRRTETFTVYKIPGPTPTPYGMGIDDNDNIWYVSFYTDVTGRLDSKTGKFTEYPSPYGERSTRDLWEDSKGGMWYGAQDVSKVGYFRVRTPSEMAAVRNVK